MHHSARLGPSSMSKKSREKKRSRGGSLSKGDWSKSTSNSLEVLTFPSQTVASTSSPEKRSRKQSISDRKLFPGEYAPRSVFLVWVNGNAAGRAGKQQV